MTIANAITWCFFVPIGIVVWALAIRALCKFIGEIFSWLDGP